VPSGGEDDPFVLKAECRRSLHRHAIDARATGWSAAEWEEWSDRFAVVLVKTIGQRERDAIVKMVWRLR